MTKFLMIALALSGLALGGAATAQERGGMMNRAEVEARAAERFERMDVNGDGMLDAADREARARQRFAEADRNGDGQLSYEEMQASREERRVRRQERMAMRGDRRGARLNRRGGRSRDAMLRRADSDGDNAVSRSEFAAAALARFDRLDANRDGVIGANERRARQQDRRNRRGETRGNR